MTQEKFTEEARRLLPVLQAEARRYLDNDDADDIVQDVLLRLWQMVDELRMPLDGLATVLTRNRCIDRLRRNHPSVAVSEAGLAADACYAIDDERIDRLLAVVDTLPSLQQTILRLRHMEGMEMKDIAALIGSNEVAVRKALSRARQSVRQQYMERYEQ